MKTASLESMSVSELQDRLKLFGARASHLCGRMPNGEPLGPAVKKFFDDLTASTTDAEKIRQRNEFLERASKDPVARQQLCAIRVETLNNYILASVNIVSMFFDIVNLGDDERPVVQNTTDQEIQVAFVGADGGLKSVKVVKDDDETLINLHYLTTERVRYRRVDIYRGTIVDAALKTLRLAYDMKNQMDGQAYTLLTHATLGAFGAFIYPGSAAGGGAGSGTVPPTKSDGSTVSSAGVDYTFLPNSRINVANLPKTNDIVLGDNSGTSTFRYRVLREIKRYADKWSGAFPEGDLVPTGRVLIPANDASDIAEEIQPTGNTNNQVANDLLEKGWSVIDYLGYKWILATDNTLPPKSCLAQFNRRPGKVYLKPSQDREVVRGEDVYELQINNEEERWAQKVFGVYINNAQRMNILRVTYQS